MELIVLLRELPTNDTEAKHIIAENVSRLLDVRHMTQKELAKLAGENEMAISRVVRGVHIPNAALLGRIAEGLSVSVDSLLTKPNTQRRQTGG